MFVSRNTTEIVLTEKLTFVGLLCYSAPMTLLSCRYSNDIVTMTVLLAMVFPKNYTSYGNSNAWGMAAIFDESHNKHLVMYGTCHQFLTNTSKANSDWPCSFPVLPAWVPQKALISCE